MDAVNAIAIEVDFSSAKHGPAEERATTGDLRILIGSEVATRVEDSWARSVRDRIRVSCYPLAQWLAASWWRLFHDAPSTQPAQPLEWRMSHELASAGGGYLWPRLTLEPDGETVEVECRPSRRVLAEPLRFLSRFRTTVPVGELERELARFISLVVARLDAMGQEDTPLHTLWAEVQAERADAQAAAHRRLEAELGYDADEGPAGVIADLGRLQARAGRAALDEIASGAGAGRVRATDPAAFLRAVEELGSRPGMAATFDTAVAEVGRLESTTRPWERGRALATGLRRALALQRGPVNDDVLAGLLGGDFATPAAAGPVALAVRGEGRRATIHFRRANPAGRRFEAARLVAEQALAPVDDRWLAATDAATARQKAQRAFAAELLRRSTS